MGHPAVADVRRGTTRRPWTAYLIGGRILVVLTAPLIYALFVPLLLLDAMISLYQRVCFPIYGIPRAPRASFFVFDRHRLAYLNGIEKINCLYCSYANGLLAFAREVAARTEQHWCPIRHAAPVASPHSRYGRFLPYGDVPGYHAGIERVRRDFGDLAGRPDAGSGPKPAAAAGSTGRGVLGAAALVLLAGCATMGASSAPPERVAFPLDAAEWTLALSAADAALSVREFVAPGESAEEWTRFVSIQVFSSAHVPYPGTAPALEECRDALTAVCPAATWSVLRESARDALFEWRIEGCGAEPDQHEVGRLIRGHRVWARITFTVKGEMDAATREEWLRRLSEARLVPRSP